MTRPLPPSDPVVRDLTARLGPADATPRLRTLFWGVLALTLAVKLALAAAIPILGDEAYFILWGRNPALGYYDHPPLVGWILAGLLSVSDALVWLRLPSVLLSTGMALGAVALLRRVGYADDRDGADRAYLVGIALLLLPIHLVGVFTLTDTALVLCAFASGVALLRAAEDDDLRWYAASGVALGLAFLAKYLAVLLGLGYLVWWLGSGGSGASGGWLPPRRRNAGFAILLAAAAPFVLFNLWWNATHCWSNVVFNLVSRHAGEGHNYSVARNLLFYGAAQLYMATPVALWFLVRRRRRLRAALAEPPFRVAAAAFGVPLSVLLLFACTSVFGAYWVLPFYPFFFLLLHRVLERRDLVRTAIFLAVFAALHVAVVGAAALAPLDAWRGVGFYRSMVTMERTGELLDRLEELEPGLAGPGISDEDPGRETHLAATGYSLASILSYRRGETVAVLGPGTHYARQDDFLTDFRQWDGDRVVVVSKRPLDPDDFRPWFARVRGEELPFHGVTVSVLVGEGFDYGAYRDGVLEEVRRRYYRVPGWLPEWGCPFCEKYGGSQRSHPAG